MPDPALLQLAIASGEQLDLGLALIDGICRPAYAAALDAHHLLWCNSLSKALPPDLVQPDNDPLQLLRSWISPATWQRLRLRFPRRRVLELEDKPPSLNGSHSRLDTLWHAVVWRIGALNHNGSVSESWAHGD
ncbi:type III secretion protein [Pseudomonas cedrina]|nr:type III secretion protein [Pseudomonas cedrina]